MSGEWGRIHRKFHSHVKAERAGLAAIGLWTICNSWCRDNRTAGRVPQEVARGFDPSGDLCAVLVREKLWLYDGLHYVFNDWDFWNSDERPKTTAAKLVYEIIPAGHPDFSKQRLTTEVEKLLAEGIEYAVVKAALKLWLGKPNAGPTWLPYLVSEVTRKGGTGEVDTALRDAWTSGDTKPLARYGYVFTPPDLPIDIRDPQAARQFMLAAKRSWVEQLRKEL